jgi:hypothetical protein
MKGKLFTRSGEFVHEFIMPRFERVPEVAIWGSRIFVLREPFKAVEAPDLHPEYYEVCAWSVDVSDMFKIVG